MDFPQELQKYSVYRTNPANFFKDILKTELFPWQKKIVAYIKSNFCNKKGANVSVPIAVAGANGTGKSFFGMQLMLWHFCTHPGSRNIMMTNSERQTKRTGYAVLQDKVKELFPEKSVMTSSFRTCLKYDNVDTEGVWDMMFYLQTRTESGMTGMHDPNMFFFYDECIEFPEHSWRALENMWTQGRVLSYCSANPIKTDTGFHEIFLNKEDSKTWHTVNVSALELPESQMNKQLINYKRLKYGEKSDIYRCSVLGQFPRSQHDKRFSKSLIASAMYRETVPVCNHASIMALDIAESSKHGSYCAACVRRGNEVLWAETFDEGYEEFRIRVMNIIKTTQPNIIVIDANGIGNGLFYELKRTSIRSSVFPIKSHSAAILVEKFSDRRTELLWRFAEWIGTKCVKLPFDDSLLRALSKIGFETEKGRITATPKKELQKDNSLGFGILDKIDVLCYSFADEVLFNRMNLLNHTSRHVNVQLSNI